MPYRLTSTSLLKPNRIKGGGVLKICQLWNTFHPICCCFCSVPKSSTTETMKKLPILGQFLGRMCWNPSVIADGECAFSNISWGRVNWLGPVYRVLEPFCNIKEYLIIFESSSSCCFTIKNFPIFFLFWLFNFMKIYTYLKIAFYAEASFIMWGYILVLPTVCPSPV